MQSISLQSIHLRFSIEDRINGTKSLFDVPSLNCCSSAAAFFVSVQETNVPNDIHQLVIVNILSVK